MIRQFRLVWDDATLRMVAICITLFGMFMASIAIYQSLIAITVFGLSDTFYSVLLVVALVINVSGSVGVGILTDQRPSRRIMALLAATMIVSGTAIVWLGSNSTVFVVAHMLMLPLAGSLFGQLFAVARLASARLDPADKNGVLAIIRALMAVPFVIVLPIWGHLFETGLPLLTVYPVVLGVSLVMVWVIWRFWPADATAPWQETKSGLNFRASLAEMGTPPILLRVGLIGAIHAGSALCGVVLALIFNQSAGRGTADVGLFFGIFVAFEVAGTLLVGTLLRHLSRLIIIGIGTVAYAGFLILLPVLVDTAAIWALTIPAGVGGAMIYTLAISYLQDQLGSRAGAGTSLIALQRIAADGLSALIFAVGAALGGYGLAAMLGGVAMLLAISALIWIDRGRPA